MGSGYRTFNAGDILTASQVQGYLQDQAVMLFADGTARDAAVTSPTEGMVVYLTSTNFLQIYDGTSWNDVIDSAGSPAGGTMPVGTLLPYAGTTSPDTNIYLLCDGQAVSRTTYADLFTVVSTTFGVGDGSTTFNVPDLRGRIPMGLDNLGGTPANRVTDANADSLGGSLGAETHTLIEAELPSHSHTKGSLTTVTAGSHTHTFSAAVKDGSAATGAGTNWNKFVGSNLSLNSAGSHSHTISGSTATTGSDTGHNNVQPVLSIGYLIRAA